MAKHTHRRTRNKSELALLKQTKRKRNKAHKTRIEAEKAKKFVYNLSTYTLTMDQLRALGRGLKFVMTPKPDTAIKEAKESFIELARKMRCRFHFSDPEIEKPLHPLWERSGYKPNYTCNILETYFDFTWDELKHLRIEKQKQNISQEERQALQKLVDNPNVVIRKCDKNSSICILDRADYLKEGYHQLNDGIHYKKIEDTRTRETQSSIMKIVRELDQLDQIDKETKRFLEKTYLDNRTAKCYFLPKVHKFTKQQLQELEGKGLGNNRIPGRPIISQCQTPTERIAKFLDIHLLPFVQRQSSYIQDTPAFLRSLEKLKVPKDAYLISFDCAGMYSQLFFHEILQAVEATLPQWIETPPLPKIEKKYLLKIIKIILENNVFEFDNTLYEQIVGCSMGNIASPEIADLTLGSILQDIFEKFPHQDQILYFGRYRDDGFMIWQAKKETIEKIF